MMMMMMMLLLLMMMMMMYAYKPLLLPESLMPDAFEVTSSRAQSSCELQVCLGPVLGVLFSWGGGCFRSRFQ